MKMRNNPVVNSGPLVSILMPLFNEGRFVRTALASLVGQSYRNIEILVSDNCSTDNTWEIVQEFAQRDPRIQPHRQPSNVGTLKNMASAKQLASGEFMMVAAGHDYYLPSFVSACVAELIKDPGVFMAYPRAHFMDVDGNALGPTPTNLDTRGMKPASRVNVVLWGIEYPYQMYGLFRRDMYDGLESKNVLAPDVLFLVRAALLGAFAQVPETLLHMRQNKDYGNVDAYAKKIYINGTGVDDRHPDRLYYEMLGEYIQVIKAHLPPGTERNALISSVVLAMATRHHSLQNFGRRVAGVELACRSDLESAVDRFAFEFEDMLLTRDNTEKALHAKAREDVLRQFKPEELVSLMSYRELARGVVRRIQHGIQRRFRSS